VKASTLPSWAPGQAAVGAGSAAGKNPRPRVAAAPERRADRRLLADLAPKARPIGRAVSRSAAPSARPCAARAPPLWPPWSGGSRRCRGSAGLRGSPGAQNPLRCGCPNAGVSASRAACRHRRGALHTEPRRAAPFRVRVRLANSCTPPITGIRAPAGRKNPPAVDANRAGRNTAAMLPAGRVRSRGKGSGRVAKSPTPPLTSVTPPGGGDDGNSDSG